MYQVLYRILMESEIGKNQHKTMKVIKKIIVLLCFVLVCFQLEKAQSQALPETGISGVYEVILAVDDVPYSIKYWGEYGFKVIDSTITPAQRAMELYGVNVKLTSYRLQNGGIDSHGLLRLWKWEKALGPGIGYTEPETIGSRMAVMKTNDIMRIYDVYLFLRQNKKPWLPTEPITDDLFGLNKGDKDFLKRPVLVRENAVYGAYFNHVFFQRYGYEILGYGTIHPDTPLKTSEFTHHDWFISGSSMDQIKYITEVLGFKSEADPAPNGDYSPGPKRVFAMKDGYSHMYQGFVSPNNICGKLKFFIPLGPKPDHSNRQRLGELGITMHSLYAPDITKIYNAAIKYPGLTASKIQKNEFNESSFVLRDQAGVVWQIIEKKSTQHQPATKVTFTYPNN
jgi:hypothetical protein